MEPDSPEGIFNRRMKFCPSLLTSFRTDELYAACDHCQMYLCVCCQDRDLAYPCHHYPVVFVDGACRGHGVGGGEASGIGIVLGEEPYMSRSIPIDERVDPGGARTSQRAELLAAIAGLSFLYDMTLDNLSRRPSARNKAALVVATDSEYVCKGIYEWMPRWKRNGWKNSQGKPVANSDLFRKLDETISDFEARHFEVGFWWIERQFNQAADALAKAACRN